MVRALFLAFVSVACLACSHDEVELFPPIPPDSPAGKFQAEIQEYLQQYEAEFALFHLQEGIHLWEELTNVLYRDIRAWDWLETSPPDDVVTLKRGTRLSDLPREVQLAVEGVLNWDPYAIVEETDAFYEDFWCSKEYLAILFDLLGGDHPLWNQYITLFEQDWMGLTSKAWCLQDFVQTISENPTAFDPSLIRRVQEVAKDCRLGTVALLRRIAGYDDLQYREGREAWDSSEAAEWRAVGRLIMERPLSPDFPLADPRLQKFATAQLELEALVANLP